MNGAPRGNSSRCTSEGQLWGGAHRERPHTFESADTTVTVYFEARPIVHRPAWARRRQACEWFLVLFRAVLPARRP
jgi:hypothetical protein